MGWESIKHDDEFKVLYMECGLKGQTSVQEVEGTGRH